MLMYAHVRSRMLTYGGEKLNMNCRLKRCLLMPRLMLSMIFFATKPQPSWLLTLEYLTIDTFSPSHLLHPLALAFSVIINPFLETSFSRNQR